MSNKVTVVGSLNVDTKLRIKRMPLPGETLAAADKTSAAGGKGANPASIGNGSDEFGRGWATGHRCQND